MTDETKFKENETIEEFVDRRIDEICVSAEVSPDQTLRRYMEDIISNIVAAYLIANGDDREMPSLNDFFECEDFIELTWKEIYKGIFYSGLVLEYNAEDNQPIDPEYSFEPDSAPEPKKVIHFANEMN